MHHALSALLIGAAAALLAAPAHAARIGSVEANGNLVDTSFSTASMLSVSIDANNFRSVSIEVLSEAGDAAVLPLNGLVRNFIGLGIPQLELKLVGARFERLGSAQGSFGSLASVAGGSDWARISLSPAENFELAYGDWFLDGSGSDFGIRWEGSAFTLSVSAVPEPGSVALMAGGLALLGGLVRRRSR